MNYNRITYSKKHDQVVRLLAEWVESGRLQRGEFLPAERDLAQETGVSRPTLRRVLDDLEQRGCLRGQGRRGRILIDTPGAQTPLTSQAVAIIGCPRDPLPLGPTHSTGFTLFIHLGAMQAAHARQWEVLTLARHNLSLAGIDRLIGERPRGALVLAEGMASLQPSEVMARLQRVGLSAVAFADETDLPDCDTVYSDHEAGAHDLTCWVLQRGARRILRYDELADASRAAPTWRRARDAGHARAMRQAGLEPLPPCTRPALPPTPHDESGFRLRVQGAAGSLLEWSRTCGRPDALMAISDGHVQVLSAACQMLGWGDLCLVGYDNYWLDTWQQRIAPAQPAATVDKLNPRLGAEMVQLLSQRLRGELPAQPQHRRIAPQVIDLTSRSSNPPNTP